MDEIRDAFQKVKQDIFNLSYELNFLKTSLGELSWKLSKLNEELVSLKDINKELISTSFRILEKDSFQNPTHEQENKAIPIQNPTDNSPFKSQKDQNLGISIGNEGVPTDRQTNQQTQIPSVLPPETPKNPLQDASKILESLDSLKKEIRLKFKRLTDKEILVFSTLYQLEEEQGYGDYKAIAQRLSLTESSIREYIGKIIAKGIPVDKTKLNNKNIQLNVSEGLKKVVSLQTILKLREL